MLLDALVYIPPVRSQPLLLHFRRQRAIGQPGVRVRDGVDPQLARFERISSYSPQVRVPAPLAFVLNLCSSDYCFPDITRPVLAGSSGRRARWVRDLALGKVGKGPFSAASVTLVYIRTARRRAPPISSAKMLLKRIQDRTSCIQVRCKPLAEVLVRDTEVVKVHRGPIRNIGLIVREWPVCRRALAQQSCSD